MDTDKGFFPSDLSPGLPCFSSESVHIPTMASTDSSPSSAAAASGIFKLGGGLPVHRLGFGAMRITGEGVWGEPKDPAEARRVLRKAVELGVNLIDTADSYGPE